MKNEETVRRNLIGRQKRSAWLQEVYIMGVSSESISQGEMKHTLKLVF